MNVDSTERTHDPIATLRASLEEFVRCVESLPEEVFLTKIVNWTPRDVVAHLIGWNRQTREGCDEMRAGTEPFYFSDIEHDFRHVNAAAVARYAGTEKRALINELIASHRELEHYLMAMEPEAWDRDFGIRYRDRPVTIRSTIKAIARDYDRHRQRLEESAQNARRR